MTDSTTVTPILSGIATLAGTRPVDGFSPEHDPWRVHGVAISENAVTRGGSGTRRFWPAETLRSAADRDLLVGQPIVKNFHDLEGQAPADDVIGKVTQVGYADDMGLVYEGEINDKHIAEKVDADYLDVSPVPLISDETFDEDRQAQRVERIERFRDLAVVAEGASFGNQIEMGPNPGVAALSAEVLSQGFDIDIEALQRDQARRPTYSDTEEVEWDTPTLDDYLRGYDSLPDPDPDDIGSVGDLSDEGRTLIAEKSLLGTPSGDTLGEVRFFPVVNPESDALNRNALGAVRGGRGEQADIPSDALASAQQMAGELLVEEFDSDIDVEATASADTGGDDGSNGNTSQSTPANDDSLHMDLTDKEQELVAAARQTDDPTVVEAEVPERLTKTQAQLEEHQDIIDEFEALEDAEVVSAEEYETLQERVETVEELMAEALQERAGLSDATVERMPFDAMAAEFEGEDGSLDMEALTQSPESGAGTPGPDDTDTDVDLEALNTDLDVDGETEAVELLQNRHEQYDSAGWESNAEEVAEDLEALGVEV